ncbi:hypothetical protein DSAG12_03052 [Promethearchaeum syntrophicum]|uniref:DUF7670 domain-containing protein n=1 Tax=Promethearchaeum syntrophicum TaxID=2594042 RepID=A0A5B9DEJ6_9ARCH|nr:hypothetical protein [Candidatus Prometheoarchaeum syntrophicum]QEE17220.1 hypothetical protein DSAG12_03052 [Candidatus Prometheoarchaeum syntrophicum]
MSKILLWFGRILGGFVVLIFTGGLLFVAIGSILEENSTDTNSGDFLEVLPMVIMIPLQLISYIITWFPKKRGELIGGIAMTTLSLCMGAYVIYDAGSLKLTMGSIFCIPFLIPGIVFIIYSQMKQNIE